MPENRRFQYLLKGILLLLILLIGAASRLPQLLSDNLLLDGDECIVGLMAKHINEGKPTILYFYGQKYGFAYFEALAGAISFKLFGYGALQLKAAMLVLWLGCLAFFYLTAVKLTGLWQGFLLTLVFAVFPAWAVWSLKARGGYLTSFLFSSAILYFFIKRRTDFPAMGWFLIGIGLGLVFYAQAFWLAGLFPIIFYHLLKHPALKNKITGLAGILVVFLLFHFFGRYTSNFWNPKVIDLKNNLFESLADLPDHLYFYLSGSYYLDHVTKLNLFIRLTIIPVIALLILGLGLQGFRVWKFVTAKKNLRAASFILEQAGQLTAPVPFLLARFYQTSENLQLPLIWALFNNGYRNGVFFYRQFTSRIKPVSKAAAKILWLRGTPEGQLLFLSVILILGYSLFLRNDFFGFRYLLPLIGFLLLWLGAEFNQLFKLKLLSPAIAIFLAIFMTITGSLALYNYKKFNFLATIQYDLPSQGNEEAHLKELTNFLQAHNIQHLYSQDQLLEWFPIFYSGEKIICRSLQPTDRYPLYPEQVNAAFAAGKPTAFFGYLPVPERLKAKLNRPEAVREIGYRYYIYPNPDFKELVRLGFYKVPGQPANPELVEELAEKNRRLDKLLNQEITDY